jgi:Transglutaminase-like superfamily
MIAGGRAARALRAGWWTMRAGHAVRSQLGDHALAPVAVPAVPAPLATGPRVVEAVLRARRASCLERAIVLQAWFLARGRPRDVVIGVRPSADFDAHAWLDGERSGAGYGELLRRPPTDLVLSRRHGIRGSRRSPRPRPTAPSSNPSGGA